MNHSVKIASNSYPLVNEIGYMGDEKGVLKHPDRLLQKMNVFIYVTEGKLQITEDHTSYELEKGSYLFLKKNIHHWGEAFYQPGSKWFYIHFFDHSEANKANPEYRTYAKTSLIPEEEYETCITLPKQGTIHRHRYVISQINSLLEMYQSVLPMRPMLVSMKLQEFFLELYMEQHPFFTNQKSHRIVRKMLQFIDDHTGKKMSSTDIADGLGMNYAYLSSLFKQYTGKSVTQYQNEKLIENAIELFKRENYNVAEVSEQLGFSNPFYFSRVFKKITGLSPSAYLKQMYRPY